MLRRHCAQRSDYIELTVGDSYSDAGATADNVDDAVNVTPSGSVDTTTGGFYAITYKATDSAGNDATPVVRVITWGPVLGQNLDVVQRESEGTGHYALGDSSVNHPVGNEYSDAGATAADSGTDPDATVDVVTYGLSDVDTDVLGTYTIIYTATDSDGNRATPVVRTVTVVDETSPTIVLNGNAAISHPW